jgi:hypothetical protein
LHAAGVTTATAQQLLRQLLADGHAARPLVDIGSSSVSGLRHPNPFATRGKPGRMVAHPVQHIRSLNAAEAAAVGSDTVRAGRSFLAPALDSAGSFTDPTGVRWAWSNGEPTLLGHPLEQAGVRGIRRHPRPDWSLTSLAAPAAPAQQPADQPADRPADGPAVQDAAPAATPDGAVLVLEPPCPGMLELAMALRNPWQFMHDITDGWRVAGALLDWSLQTLLEAYGHVLQALPQPPDLVVISDVLGFRAGMYLPVSDFRAQYLPRLRALVLQLRDLTGAAVLLRCQGAVGPLLGQLATLEPDLLHLQRDVAGLEVCRLRAAIPATTSLHGVVDLVRLGRTLAGGDTQRATQEAVRLAEAWPAVAAPLGIVPADVAPDVLARAASFVRCLTPATLRALHGEPDPARVLAPLFCRSATVDLAADGRPALALP